MTKFCLANTFLCLFSAPKPDEVIKTDISRMDDNGIVEDPIFNCQFCQATFKWRHAFYKHLREVHPTPVSQVSQLAIATQTPTTENRSIAAQKLLVAVDDPKSIASFFRPVAGASKPVLAVNENQLVVCKICALQVKGSTALKVHMLEHSEEPERKYSCSRCRQSFVSDLDLRFHGQEVHGEKFNSCPKCPKVFDSKNLLRLHYIKLHKVTPCPRCKIEFPSRMAAKEHFYKIHKKASETETDMTEIPNEVEDIGNSQTASFQQTLSEVSTQEKVDDSAIEDLKSQQKKMDNSQTNKDIRLIKLITKNTTWPKVRLTRLVMKGPTQLDERATRTSSNRNRQSSVRLRAKSNTSSSVASKLGSTKCQDKTKSRSIAEFFQSVSKKSPSPEQSKTKEKSSFQKNPSQELEPEIVISTPESNRVSESETINRKRKSSSDASDAGSEKRSKTNSFIEIEELPTENVSANLTKSILICQTENPTDDDVLNRMLKKYFDKPTAATEHNPISAQTSSQSSDLILTDPSNSSKTDSIPEQDPKLVELLNCDSESKIESLQVTSSAVDCHIRVAQNLLNPDAVFDSNDTNVAATSDNASQLSTPEAANEKKSRKNETKTSSTSSIEIGQSKSLMAPMPNVDIVSDTSYLTTLQISETDPGQNLLTTSQISEIENVASRDLQDCLSIEPSVRSSTSESSRPSTSDRRLSTTTLRSNEPRFNSEVSSTDDRNTSATFRSLKRINNFKFRSLSIKLVR